MSKCFTKGQVRYIYNKIVAEIASNVLSTLIPGHESSPAEFLVIPTRLLNLLASIVTLSGSKDINCPADLTIEPGGGRILTTQLSIGRFPSKVHREETTEEHTRSGYDRVESCHTGPTQFPMKHIPVPPVSVPSRLLHPDAFQPSERYLTRDTSVE